MRKHALNALFALGSVTAALPSWVAADEIIRSPNPVPGQYIVVIKGTAAKPNYFTGRNEIDVDAIAAEIAHKHKAKVGQVWKHALNGMVVRMSEKEAQILAQNPDVIVEEDGIVSINATQSGATWGLDRIDQRNLPLDSTYGYNVDGSGVTAYIIDTGIRTTHADFGGRASGGFTAITDGNGTNDCNGHGTHVSGTVGGSTYGVAKSVKLVAVRVLDCNGSGTSSGVISGVNWVTANRVLPAVANMSLGGGLSSSLNTAVQSSIAAGVTYAVAAGNSNADACTTSPASVAAALTVGATDSGDNRASFSNYGTCLDIFAPGVSITSDWSTSDTATNTISGTSMATPHVTGAAALYLSAVPGATPAQVASALTGSGTANVVKGLDTASPNLLLYTGFIQAPTPDTTPPTVSVTSPTAGQTLSGATVTLSANAADNVAVAKVEFFVDGLSVGTDSSSPYSLSWDSNSVANGSHSFTAKATDTSNNATTSAAVSADVSNAAQPPACSTASQLLANEGFESGAISWTQSSAAIINNNSLYLPHSGSWKAKLDGNGKSTTDTLYQQISIPVNACSATFSFWVNISTLETGRKANDKLTVSVLNSSGQTLKNLATYSNQNKTAGYVQQSFDLSAYKGQTVRVQFKGVENASYATTFTVDDTAFNITQ